MKIDPNMDFLKFTIRILWQSFLLLLVPVAIALAIVVPLALLTKSVRVEAEVVAGEVSFTLAEGRHGGQDLALLQAVRGRQVSVLTKSIAVPLRKLIDKDHGKTLIEDASVELRSEPHGGQEYCEAEFAQDQGKLSFQALRLRSGSAVRLRYNTDELLLELEPKERVEARIVLPESDVSLTVTNCLVLDEQGKALAGLTESPQHRFTLEAPAQLEIASKNKTVFRILLAPDEDKDLHGAFGNFLAIARLEFPPGEGSSPIPVTAGSIRFRDVDKKDLKVEKSFIVVSPSDTFDLVAITGVRGALDLTFSGTATSLKIGKAPDPEPEELPNLLEWIYHDQQLGLIAGALVWASGTVLASLNLWDALKKLRE